MRDGLGLAATVRVVPIPEQGWVTSVAPERSAKSRECAGPGCGLRAVTTDGPLKRSSAAREGSVLTEASVGKFLASRGLVPDGGHVSVVALEGGVSGVVFAVRAPGVALVVKQALERLKVSDDWRADPDRTLVEARAMRLCQELTPGRVPRLIDVDASTHTMVMELVPDSARNWQSEVGLGRPHADAGSWAGETLGTWHARTCGDQQVAAAFASLEFFESLRLKPFYETLADRLPQVGDRLVPLVEELRAPRCFVDGDFAMKNILVSARRAWVLDLEVAHFGNPVFDVGFFLSFVVLSALRWPGQVTQMRDLAERFLIGYADAAGEDFAGTPPTVTAHTAALVLARTDGKSPAQFLDQRSRQEARDVGLMLLQRPERGLWQWL